MCSSARDVTCDGENCEVTHDRDPLIRRCQAREGEGGGRGRGEKKGRGRSYIVLNKDGGKDMGEGAG